MLGEKPLTIDFTKEDAILQVLPRAPLLSSNERGWNGIHLQHHCQPPDEMCPHCHAQHVVVIHHLKRSMNSEEMIDGRFQNASIVDGDILLVPAGVQHRSCWAEEAKFTLLTLEPAFVARVAYESIDPDCAEIVPHFPKPDPLIHQIGLALKAALETSPVGLRLYADSLATALSAHLLQYYSIRKYTIRDYEGGLSKSKLRHVIDYINNHLAEDVSLEAIATEVGMSQYHFTRLFKQSTGLTPHQYVTQRRVERARQLLLKGDRAIADIARAVGFADQSHLTRQFKRLMGTTPKEIFGK